VEWEIGVNAVTLHAVLRSERDCVAPLANS
jgi:hypothetical protein